MFVFSHFEISSKINQNKITDHLWPIGFTDDQKMASKQRFFAEFILKVILNKDQEFDLERTTEKV